MVKEMAKDNTWVQQQLSSFYAVAKQYLLS